MQKETGKLEAYFFPPLNVPPYNKDFGKVITRLGFKPHATKQQVLDAIGEFGKSDAMYELLNVYEIKSHDGWIIRPGVIHAPGPWITFEIQRPQDDGNLFAWQLGKRLSPDVCPHCFNENALKGLKDPQSLIEEALDWDNTTDARFKEKFYCPAKVIQEGRWGKWLQIFFHEFYGEGIEINPADKFTRESDSRPYAGIVWSGTGTVNGNILDATNLKQKEFLIVPNTKAEFVNTGDKVLYIYTVFPLKE